MGGKTKRQNRHRSLRHAAVAVLLVVVVAGSFWGRSGLAVQAQRMAAQRLDAWALSQAEEYLAWAAWLQPDNGEVDLLRAVSFRRWGRMPQWRLAMEAAERKNVPRTPVELEVGLSMIRSGQSQDWIEGAHRELLGAGVSPDDIGTAYLDGYLARGDFAAAARFLTLWETQFPQRSHVAYLWGFYWLQLKDYEQSFARFQRALSVEPRHELARKMIAELLETQGRLAEAAEEHAESLNRAPTSQVAKLGLARTLRKLNRTEAARELLQQIVASPDPLPVARHELGQLELETGNYAAAEKWFAGERKTDEIAPDLLLSTAVAATMQGHLRQTEYLLDRFDAVSFEMVRKYDLQLRLSLNPADTAAAGELQQLSQSPAQTGVAESVNDEATGAGLYAQHCSSCHGDDGRGDGRAARHLFPRARAFRHERFRLVSSANRVPTIDDLVAVIKNGMPGTSMPSFQHLSKHQHRLLAEEVLKFHRLGVSAAYAESLREAEEEIVESDVESYVRGRTTPGDIVPPPPPEKESSAASIERGERAYAKLGCAQCHGPKGRFETIRPVLADDQHRPTVPRDLVHEPFKGGPEFLALFRRIVLGMPGTPHPAVQTATDDELADLINFCRSLSEEPKRQTTNFERRIKAERHVVLD